MRSRSWLIITGTTWKVGTNIHVWSLTRPHLGCNQGDMHSGLFKPLLAPNKNKPLVSSLLASKRQGWLLVWVSQSCLLTSSSANHYDTNHNSVTLPSSQNKWLNKKKFAHRYCNSRFQTKAESAQLAISIYNEIHYVRLTWRDLRSLPLAQ